MLLDPKTKFLSLFLSLTVYIDYRSAEGDTPRLAALAQELVQLKPDIVLASSTSPALAVKRIAPALPIVCPTFGDSFVPTLAASFARPGGNVTGIASNVEGLLGKLTELTLAALPGTTRIGFLSNPAGAWMAQNERQVRSTAQARGVEQVGTREDVDGALQPLRAAGVQAVIVPANGLLNSAQKRIVETALALRLPLLFSAREGVDAGGFASYGVDLSENWRRAAIYVDKILKGAAPGNLPIEFSTKIDLVFNIRTAKVLGITVPLSLLARADEVIE